VTAADSDSAELEHWFDDSSGTVTHLIEELTGELVVADVVRQQPMEAGQDNGLGVAAGQVVTFRAAVLKGQSTGRPYLYAESIYQPERLPEPARRQLAQTSDPIGRMLAVHGLTAARAASLTRLGERGGPTWAQVAPAEIVWNRAYRLTVGGDPVFAITEWFCRSVLEALPPRAASS
jgi:chorismate-pyruvate lyase